MSIFIAAYLGFISIALRLIDYTYYSLNANRILSTVKLKRFGNRKAPYYKKCDPVFAVFPFLWSWLDIFAVAIIVKNYPNVFLSMLGIVFVGSRYRELQEAGHTALHFGLCKSKRWQWFLSNFFFQFPCFKPDMYNRQIHHTFKHHRHPNKFSKDPNLVRFIAVGFLPGMSNAEFYRKLLFPLSIRGLLETLSNMLKGTTLDRNWHTTAIRMCSVTFFMALFYYCFGLKLLIIIYLVPQLTIYPLFSWISLLVEHRWFVHSQGDDRYINECVNCRPTDYVGISGWLLKQFIFPYTDHYHLAHSLFPFVRWNYLKCIDNELKLICPHYKKYRSQGLLCSKKNTPSALSELKERMTLCTLDLASWVKAYEVKLPETTNNETTKV